jgi:FHS family L-fucose permease-like MFS transporter
MHNERLSERTLLYTVYFIYFFCGLTQCFEGVFLPEFKEHFHLSYQQQMYTLFAKNIPSVLALLIGLQIARIGYKNCLTVAMICYGLGTLLLVPGLETARYEIVLLGFFLIGTGFSFQIVSGNPLLCALGPEQASSSRLNFGNALGAVAQIIAPATLALILPVSAISVSQKRPYIDGLFIALAAVLFLTMIVTAFLKNVSMESRFDSPGSSDAASQTRFWTNRHLMSGFVCVLLVLGVEAGLFGLYRNYLEDPAIAGLSSRNSQLLFTIYFALFAAGRLAGSWIQRRILPATHLLISLAGALLCLALVVTAKGWLAVAAVTGIGFFISIFYPTLYALIIEGMGKYTGEASGLLTMAFLGCAFIPVLQGRLADSIGLQPSYLVGAGAYVLTALYTIGSLRSAQNRMKASEATSV